jgi:hypothetical protein
MLQFDSKTIWAIKQCLNKDDIKALTESLGLKKTSRCVYNALNEYTNSNRVLEAAYMLAIENIKKHPCPSRETKKIARLLGIKLNVKLRTL